MKKIISLLISALLLATVFCGCGGKGDDGGDATLIWAMPFYEQDDTTTVLKEINALIDEKLPGTQIKFLMDSSMGNKWSLWMAGDNQIDIAHAGYVNDLQTEILKKSYYNLDELIEKYAPAIAAEKEKYPEQYATGAFNGSQYAIPNLQVYINDEATLEIPEDLISYIDAEAMVKEAWANPKTTEKMYQIIDDYLKAAVASGKAESDYVAPLINIESMYRTFARRGYAFVGNTSVYTNPINVCYEVFTNDGSVKFINFYETEEFKMFMKWARKWYQAGYISTDVLSGDAGYGNRSPMLYADAHEMLKTDGSGIKLEEARLATLSNRYLVSLQSDEQKYVSNVQIGSLLTYNTIPSTAKYPERAMKLLNLLRTEEGADILNMICYGIEGEHYEFLEDGSIKAFDYRQQGMSDSKFGIPNWMVGTHLNMLMVFPYEAEQKQLGLDYYDNVYPKYYRTGIAGLTFDFDSISNYYSQLASVLAEYQLQIISGAVPNYEAKHKEAIDLMKTAGIDKIIAELQKQADAYIASK